MFPLVVSNSAGLGVDFALVRSRAARGRTWSSPTGLDNAEVDLAAVSHLDKVRTADLALSRENLQPRGPEHKPF